MKITAAHGSGGRDSARLMRDIFGKHFSNPVLDRLEDAAVLELDPRARAGRMALTTDSFVVTPLEFRGGDIGKLSVCGTVNDLLAVGAEPAFLTCGFILEEGLELALLERVVRSAARTAAEAGVRIVAGDTKVAGLGGGLLINTTGVGFLPEGREISPARCAPGDALLLSGELGDHHACVLSARMGVENEIASDCACLGDVTRALFDAGVRVKALRDVTRGGLATVLNEITAACGLSAELWEESLPVNAAVEAFCGLMGLDPLYMGNEGKLLAVVADADAPAALAAVRRAKNGRNAALVGRVTDEAAGVTLRTRLGGSRRVDVLYGEGLPRIC